MVAMDDISEISQGLSQFKRAVAVESKDNERDASI